MVARNEKSMMKLVRSPILRLVAQKLEKFKGYCLPFICRCTQLVKSFVKRNANMFTAKLHLETSFVYSLPATDCSGLVFLVMTKQTCAFTNLIEISSALLSNQTHVTT